MPFLVPENGDETRATLPVKSSKTGGVHAESGRHHSVLPRVDVGGVGRVWTEEGGGRWGVKCKVNGGRRTVVMAVL